MIDLTSYIKDNDKALQEVDSKLHAVEREKADVLLSKSIIEYFKNMKINKSQLLEVTIDNKRKLITSKVKYNNDEVIYSFPKENLRHDLSQHKNDFAEFVNDKKYYVILCNKVSQYYASINTKYNGHDGYHIKQDIYPLAIVFTDFDTAKRVANACDSRMTPPVKHPSSIEPLKNIDLKNYTKISIHINNLSSKEDLVEGFVLTSSL